MPVSRRLAENLARTLVEIYGRTAERMAADVARRLDQDLAGIGRPDFAERRLLAAEALHEQSRRLVDRLDTEMADAVEQMTVLAAERGSAEALRELGRLGFALPSTMADVRRELPGAEAVQRLAFSLTSTLRGTHLRITRWPVDVYREVTSRASADILLGTATRRQAAQRMWQDFVSRGVTGFVDRSGRAWRLESYVDMASRTIAAQAATEAHLDRLGEAGVDLVIVSDAPQECPLCRPWEGRVLARSGSGARTVEVEHATQDGVQVPVQVAGSLDQAIAAGLFHPNCRHSVSGFFPGITSARGPGQLAEEQPPSSSPARAAGAEPPLRPAPVEGAATLDVPDARLNVVNLTPGETGILFREERVELEWRGGRPEGWSTARARGHARTLADYTAEEGAAAPSAIRAGGTASRRAAGRIANVLATSTTAQDMRVWRGLDSPRHLFGDALDRPLVGAEVRDPSFMSVSGSREVAGRYAGDSGLLLRMNVPAGTNAVTLDNLDDVEVLLDRGLTLRITGDTGPGSSPRIVDVEVLP